MASHSPAESCAAQGEPNEQNSSNHFLWRGGTGLAGWKSASPVIAALGHRGATMTHAGRAAHLWWNLSPKPKESPSSHVHAAREHTAAALSAQPGRFMRVNRGFF